MPSVWFFLVPAVGVPQGNICEPEQRNGNTARAPGAEQETRVLCLPGHCPSFILMQTGEKALARGPRQALNSRFLCLQEHGLQGSVHTWNIHRPSVGPGCFSASAPFLGTSTLQEEKQQGAMDNEFLVPPKILGVQKREHKGQSVCAKACATATKETGKTLLSSPFPEKLHLTRL